MAHTLAIETIGLGKTFGRGKEGVRAVHNLNLAVEPEQVYGFLGPNGAGKTTTIRLLMGLIQPTEGLATVFGQDVRRNPAVLRQVGALVEDAAFYNYMTGRDNLTVLARTANSLDPARVQHLLEMVGLAARASQQVGNYSTGMKQRLGIAAALLGDPALVILDEPVNGLDPAGIQEMRHLIRSLAHRQGKTVFLSSHLLTEVEQVCDRVAIIDHGQVIREGLVADLLSDSRGELWLQVAPADQAASILQPHWETSPSLELNWVTVRARPEEGPLIVQRLVEQGISVFQVVVKRQTLEDFFLHVTAANSEVEHG